MNIKKILIVLIILSVTSVKAKTEISDSIFATIGNKVITRSDIVNEIKIILISAKQQFAEDKLESLQAIAVKELVKRNIKRIEINKYANLQFNQSDLQNEIIKLAQSMNTDVETLKNTLTTNDINYETLIEIYKTELLWNSLIFDLYKNSISINKEEVDEQLKLIQNQKEITEYLISEIIISHVNKAELDSEVEKIKSTIKTQGFENTALKLSISESALAGGDIGWVGENTIPNNLKIEMDRIQIGEISEAIALPEGILFFKLRDKRNMKEPLNIEDAKGQLINAERIKILKMHSLSHYDKLRRIISVNYK